jgi:mycothiol system anti-sigma-R factor
MSCREVVELLWEYIDAELTPEREQQVRAHLEACKACYGHYEFQQAFVAFVKRHGAQVAPAELRARVTQSILEQDSVG